MHDAPPPPPDVQPGPASARPSRPEQRGTPRVLVAVAFVPVAFAVLLGLLAPGFYAPLVDGTVNLAGLQPIVPFGGALAVLLAIDLAVFRLVRAPLVHGLVLALTTTIGLFLVILAPALVLIAATLGPIND